MWNKMNPKYEFHLNSYEVPPMKKVIQYFKWRRDDQRIGLLFISPFIIGCVFIFIKFLLTAIGYAFSTITPTSKGFVLAFSGFKNFYTALRVDPAYFQYLLGAMQSILTTVPIVLIFSLFIAVVLNGKVKGRAFFRVVFFLTVFVTTGLISQLDVSNSVMQAMNTAATTTDDTANTLLSIGNVTVFLQQLKFSPALIQVVSAISSNIVEIVNLSGVQILIFLAALQSISPSVYEAADVEGASAWEKFWKITLPMVVPMMIVNLLYTLIDFLTRSNTGLIRYINNVAFVQGSYGVAAAMAWMYCFCVLFLLLVGFVVFKVIKHFYNDDARG